MSHHDQSTIRHDQTPCYIESPRLRDALAAPVHGRPGAAGETGETGRCPRRGARLSFSIAAPRTDGKRAVRSGSNATACHVPASWLAPHGPVGSSSFAPLSFLPPLLPCLLGALCLRRANVPPAGPTLSPSGAAVQIQQLHLAAVRRLTTLRLDPHIRAVGKQPAARTLSLTNAGISSLRICLRNGGDSIGNITSTRR